MSFTCDLIVFFKATYYTFGQFQTTLNTVVSQHKRLRIHSSIDANIRRQQIGNHHDKNARLRLRWDD